MRSFLIATILCAAPVALCADAVTTETQQHAYTQIDADQLKEFYDQNRPMVVLDARSKPYFEGTLLPNAKWVPVDTVTDAEIQALIPSKDTLVIVYCANPHCPAGGMLGDKLVSMGYTKVHKYPGGLDDWMQKGYPTTKK